MWRSAKSHSGGKVTAVITFLQYVLDHEGGLRREMFAALPSAPPDEKAPPKEKGSKGHKRKASERLISGEAIIQLGESVDHIVCILWLLNELCIEDGVQPTLIRDGHFLARGRDLLPFARRCIQEFPHT